MLINCWMHRTPVHTWTLCPMQMVCHCYVLGQFLSTLCTSHTHLHGFLSSLGLDWICHCSQIVLQLSKRTLAFLSTFLFQQLRNCHWWQMPTNFQVEFFPQKRNLYSLYTVASPLVNQGFPVVWKALQSNQRPLLDCKGSWLTGGSHIKTLVDFSLLKLQPFTDLGL